MTSSSNDASSSDSSSASSNPSGKRTVQSGGIDRSPGGTGVNMPRDVSGIRTCYLCYDEAGERICNEIPCPSDVGGQVVSSSLPAADASGIAAARAKPQKGSGAGSQRTVQSGGIDRGQVLDRPVGGSGIELPRDVSGLAEACYMCHEHENGETVCHEITCP